jgi:hypothetical protein
MIFLFAESQSTSTFVFGKASLLGTIYLPDGVRDAIVDVGLYEGSYKQNIWLAKELMTTPSCGSRENASLLGSTVYATM